jgi:hypothetical protein
VKELIKKGADVNIKNLVSLHVDPAFKFEMSLSSPNLTYTSLSLSLSTYMYTYIHLFRFKHRRLCPYVYIPTLYINIYSCVLMHPSFPYSALKGGEYTAIICTWPGLPRRCTSVN